MYFKTTLLFLALVKFSFSKFIPDDQSSLRGKGLRNKRMISIALPEIGKPSCCKELKGSLDKKNFAYRILCPVFYKVSASYCRDIKVDVDNLNIAYGTLCPTNIGKIDHCLAKPCDANAICTNTNHSYSCKCNAGFSGNGIQCTAVVADYTAECSNYVWLNETNRNKNYSGRHDLCDYQQISPLLWYRFGGQAGIKIATYCVPHGNCGSASTGWMLGTHPTVSAGKVNRTVCYMNSYNNCCWQSNNIEVLNCGNYFVYNLVKTPSCTYRYCGSFN